jgi:hypothetical protein
LIRQVLVAGESDVIKRILKALVLAFIAKKFLGRDDRSSRRRT